MPTRSDRGQSEAIGSLLFFGFVTALVASTGGFVASNYTQNATRNTPLVDCSFGYSDGSVTVTHTGGSPIADG